MKTASFGIPFGITKNFYVKKRDEEGGNYMRMKE
jgi:hypothetical protein